MPMGVIWRHAESRFLIAGGKLISPFFRGDLSADTRLLLNNSRYKPTLRADSMSGWKGSCTYVSDASKTYSADQLRLIRETTAAIAHVSGPSIAALLFSKLARTRSVSGENENDREEKQALRILSFRYTHPLCMVENIH